MQQDRIGGRKFEAGQPLRRHPFQRRTADRARFTGLHCDQEELEADSTFLVVVDDLLIEADDRGVEVELFPEFAPEAVLPGFSPLALASGEFPSAGEVTARRALSDQESAMAKDKPGTDFNYGAATSGGQGWVHELPSHAMIKKSESLHFNRVQEIAAVE